MQARLIHMSMSLKDHRRKHDAVDGLPLLLLDRILDIAYENPAGSPIVTAAKLALPGQLLCVTDSGSSQNSPASQQLLLPCVLRRSNCILHVLDNASLKLCKCKDRAGAPIVTAANVEYQVGPIENALAFLKLL